MLENSVDDVNTTEVVLRAGFLNPSLYVKYNVFVVQLSGLVSLQ